MSSFLCISLPVHQAPPVLEGQLHNIARYCPNTIVVLHISFAALEQRKELLNVASKFPFVELNPVSYPTTWGGITHVHLANFLFARQRGISFEYFMFEASNSLFYRCVNPEYVRAHDMLISPFPLEIHAWGFHDAWTKDPWVKKLKEVPKISQWYYSIPEGCCYRADLFEHMARKILPHYQYDVIEKPYPSEEVIFPSVALSCSRSFSNSLCMGHFHAHTTDELIEIVKDGRRAPEYPDPCIPKHGFEWNSDSMYPPYYFQHFYSIKPFPRDENDVARRYVLDSMGD